MVVTRLEGTSFRRAIENCNWVRSAPIFWEHEGNRAVRLGEGKIVSEGITRWELYNTKTDRTELIDPAHECPDILNRMVEMYEDWSCKVGVMPWPVIPEVTDSPRTGMSHIHDVR